MKKTNRSHSDAGLPDSFLTMDLGDEYHIVTGPRVEQLGLDAVIVAPSGLVALHARQWEGKITVDARGTWRTALPTGVSERLQDPRPTVASADEHLGALLKREFPTLQCSIRHLLVCTSDKVDLSETRDASPRCVTVAELAGLLTSATETASDLLDPRDGERLTKLLSGEVAHNDQRVNTPFEFRALGAWGLKRRGRTVHEVARYLERHPEQGLVDLRSGILEQWFANAGEPRIASLARQVALQPQPSARVAIETFLVSSGLVTRPKIRVHPGRVDVGHVVLGQVGKAHVRLSKGRGRGYLFGTLETDNQWIKVSPKTFEGSVNAVVTLDSGGLSVTVRPTQAKLIVRSNASEAPLVIPVTNHVHPEPAIAERLLLRPLVAMTVAGALGCLLGWVLGAMGRTTPAWAEGLPWLPTAAPVFYAATVGILWSALGAWRGLAQRHAWPIRYALRRWLVRVGLWIAAPTVIVMVWYWFIGRLVPGWQGHVAAAQRTVLPLLACLAAIPGTIGELYAAKRRRATETVERAPLTRRAGQMAAAALVVVSLLFGSLLAYQPLGLQRSLLASTQSTRTELEQQSQSWQGKLNHLIDQAYIRLYDRRAGMK